MPTTLKFIHLNEEIHLVTLMMHVNLKFHIFMIKINKINGVRLDF
jgi:hypothetical protein